MNLAALAALLQAAGPYLVLIPQLVGAVEEVIKKSGVGQHEAMTIVGAHLSPNLPNAPALTPIAGTVASGAPTASTPAAASSAASR